jgi:2-polyprenyl-3-methyl-5-hydroxy-6-metoxy-1,4-benzoquinol methylase
LTKYVSSTEKNETHIENVTKMPLDLIKIDAAKKFLSTWEIDALNLYMNEAKYFYSVIEHEIDGPPMNIYEIGSGIGLLSRLIAERGHNVIATDPSSSGFTVIRKLHDIIEKCFETDLPQPKFYELPAQELSKNLVGGATFEYIFCANVVEHVQDQKEFFDSIIPKLKVNGVFRFICPNYWFPYEPHFGFLSLPSKTITRFIQRKKIENSNIAEVYNDLSFPNIFKLNKILNGYEVTTRYENFATINYINRAIKDEFFSLRKKRLSNLVRLFSKPLLAVVDKLPKSILPTIDCYVTRY